MPQLLFFSLRALTKTHWDKALQPCRNNIESHSTIMTAFWLGIHNLNFSLPTDVRGFLKIYGLERGTAEVFKNGSSATKQSVYLFE